MSELQSGSVAVEMPVSETIEILSNLDDSGKENEANENEIHTAELEVKAEDLKRNSIGLKTLSELNGKENFIIDLDSGMIKPKTLTGPELLFQKYLKTQGNVKKHRDTVVMNILSVDNGKLENQKVEVKLDKEVELDHLRPGFSHEKLKENLKNQILQQRLEKLKQRLVNNCGHAELEPEDKDHFPFKKEDDDSTETFKKAENNDNQDTSDEEWTGENESDVEDISGDDEEAELTQKKKTKVSEFVDDEAIDEELDAESDSESDSSEDESESEQNTTVQKKGRIIKAFEDSDEEDSVNTKMEVPKSSDAHQNDGFNFQKPHNVQRNSTEFKYCSDDLFNSQGTDITFDEPSISEDIAGNNLDALFDKPSQKNDGEEDLMDLCSGQFTATPSDIILTNNEFNISQSNQMTDSDDNFITQVPQNVDETKESQNADDSFILTVPQSPEQQKKSENADDSFILTVAQNTNEPKESQDADDSFIMTVIDDMKPVTENKSSKFDDINDLQFTQEGLKDDNIASRANINKLLESTDDEAENVRNDAKTIKRKKKKKERTKKLGFSDDESDTEDHNGINTDMLDGDLDELKSDIEDNPDVFVDYDSEENEIEVKLTKKEREKQAQGYLEHEAELSESEWGSADEDEKNLDKYDSDLADEEEFDQTKLREEVGRIHARKLMDQDLKDVKKIQDLLFEDEENDGVGRDRKFKWKNQSEGFTMVDENARDAVDTEGADQDEENEIMWRRMRHEREVLISEQSQKVGESENSILLLDQNSQTVTTASTSTLVKRKFQIIKTHSMPVELLNSSNETKGDSPFLIKSATTKKFTHSSFLSRDEKTLTKIASFISTKPDDEVTNLSSHGGNSMSFAPIEKRDDTKKRKSEGQESNNNGKKRKIENQRFLLDQLK